MSRRGATKKRVVTRPARAHRAHVLSIVDDEVRVRLDGGDAGIDALGADFGVRLFVSGPYWKTAATVIEVGDGELVLDLPGIDLDTQLVDLRPMAKVGL